MRRVSRPLAGHGEHFQFAIAEGLEGRVIRSPIPPLRPGLSKSPTPSRNTVLYLTSLYLYRIAF